MIMEGEGWRRYADPEELIFQLQEQEGLQEKLPVIPNAAKWRFFAYIRNTYRL